MSFTQDLFSFANVSKTACNEGFVIQSIFQHRVIVRIDVVGAFAPVNFLAWVHCTHSMIECKPPFQNPEKNLAPVF